MDMYSSFARSISAASARMHTDMRDRRDIWESIHKTNLILIVSRKEKLRLCQRNTYLFEGGSSIVSIKLCFFSPVAESDSNSLIEPHMLDNESLELSCLVSTLINCVHSSTHLNSPFPRMHLGRKGLRSRQLSANVDIEGKARVLYKEKGQLH